MPVYWKYNLLSIIFKTARFLRLLRYYLSLVRVGFAFLAALLISVSWFFKVSTSLLSSTIRYFGSLLCLREKFKVYSTCNAGKAILYNQYDYK